MFDDPKKELRRMQDELLAAEMEEWLEQTQSQDINELLDDAKDFLEEEPPVRNFANGYGAQPRNYAVDFDRTVYDDEEFDDDAAVFVEEPKKKGIGGLVFLAILELIGIVAIVVWWIKWLH